MEHKVLAPAVGESITEVKILEWLKGDGEFVQEGEVLLELETDKASVEVAAEKSGVLKIIKQSEEVVPVGELLGFVDDSAKAPAGIKKASNGSATNSKKVANGTGASRQSIHEMSSAGPAARKMAAEAGVALSQLKGSAKGARVSKADFLNYNPQATPVTPVAASSAVYVAPEKEEKKKIEKRALREGERREPMSRLRQSIAKRLVSAQQTAAILTTFNEVALNRVMEIRSQHKEAYKKAHGVGLSFMSFFTRAVVLALKEIPAVNGSIEGEDLIFRDFANVGIAVGTDKGLIVPVLKNVHKMSFVEIDQGIAALAEKARIGKISLDDLADGTFTISNGGTYGSMMSTPILTPPQVGILGMHNIIKRPVVVDGEIVVRPMMYLALSYDHRMIDGKEAVTFLVNIKKNLEEPENLGLDFIK